LFHIGSLWVPLNKFMNHSVPRKGRDLLRCLRDCWLLKEDSARVR
jgi:hypothetical protein